MRPITILLSDRYSDWEIAPLAGLGRAFFGADIHFSTISGGPVRSAAGLVIDETDPFAPSPGSVIVICGGPVYEGATLPNLRRSLIEAYEKACVLAGICGGTLALADAGLLDAVCHTSNAPGYIGGFVPHYTGADLYLDVPRAIRDDQVITAPGPAIASFAAECLLAAGAESASVAAMQSMLAAEHAPCEIATHALHQPVLANDLAASQSSMITST